jgi:hypothetical protein
VFPAVEGWAIIRDHDLAGLADLAEEPERHQREVATRLAFGLLLGQNRLRLGVARIASVVSAYRTRGTRSAGRC